MSHSRHTERGSHVCDQTSEEARNGLLKELDARLARAQEEDSAVSLRGPDLGLLRSAIVQARLAPDLWRALKEYRQREARVRKIYRESHSSERERKVCSELGLGRSRTHGVRGPQYDAEEIVPLYRDLRASDSRLRGAAMLVRDLDNQEKATRLPGPPPLSVSQAVAFVQDHFGFRSFDAARMFLSRELKKKGLSF